MAGSRGVTVTAPSRLHFGLIDMHGGSGRVDGSIGVSLAEPGVKLEVRPADGFGVISSPGVPEVLVETAVIAHERLRAATGAGGAIVDVETLPPLNTGLGGTTQFLLSMASGICALHGVDLPTRDVAGIIRRGGTSGIGVAAFENGGFIVDGGHVFGEGGKTDFRSSDTSDVPPAPVIFQYPLPEEWRWVCVMPEGRNVTGHIEEDIFNMRCPVPLEEVREITHLILMRAMPAVLERDIESLGAVLYRMQDIGFKGCEVDSQPEHVRGLIDRMKRGGAAGAGMSSFGPLVYGLCTEDDARNVKGAGEDFLRENGIGFESFVSATDNGAERIEVH